MLEKTKTGGSPSDPNAARAHAIVRRLLRDLGLEVGDYGHPFILVQTADGFFQVRLEGWGAECVLHDGQRGKREAYTAANKLAATWFGEGWPFTGRLPVEHPDVWELTWAVNGPLKKGALPEGVPEEEIVDLR